MCYHGALGARAMHELRSYGAGNPICDNNAYTISATYWFGVHHLYAHVILSGPGDALRYYTARILAEYLTGNLEDRLRGTRALQNARDLAKEWRDEFISAANKKAMESNQELSPPESPTRKSPIANSI
jgi:hypothetical protein